MMFKHNPLDRWYAQALRSRWKWLVVLLSGIYILSPLDLFPDVIPILGVVDDTILLFILIRELVWMNKSNSKSVTSGRNVEGKVVDSATRNDSK